MRRKLFFLMERLEISRNERIAVSVLMILLVVGTSTWTLVKPYANYDEESYTELERVFAERSRIQQAELESILARYEPAEAMQPMLPETDGYAVADTVRIDSTDEQSSPPSASLININTAGEQELQELPGIGPAYARRIVQWREQNGDFTSKDQLLEIRGIGAKRLAAIKPLITL